MDLSQIREILKIVAESGVSEVEIEEDDFKMVIRLNAPNVSIQPPASAFAYPLPYFPPPPPAYPMPAPVQHQQQPPPQAPPVAPQPASPAAPAPAPADNANTIKAPIVGTFYRSSSPEADPFVKVGDKVAFGDPLISVA